jgi:UDP-N-acetylglucosamine transferase subunit ALG13
MIFVTVGTHEQSFERLVKEIDRYAKKNNLAKEEVFIQTGFTDYVPQNCSYKKMLSYEEMDQFNHKASVIITHGGPGSMFIPWKLGKSVIAVPRLKRFDEHVDDHQLRFSKRMEKEGKVTCIEEIEELAAAIDHDLKKSGTGKNYEPKTNQFIEKFSTLIEGMLPKETK